MSHCVMADPELELRAVVVEDGTCQRRADPFRVGVEASWPRRMLSETV